MTKNENVSSLWEEPKENRVLFKYITLTLAVHGYKQSH